MRERYGFDKLSVAKGGLQPAPYFFCSQQVALVIFENCFVREETKQILRDMKNKTINFLYWIYNHTNIEGVFIECFGEHLGKHFISKLVDGRAESVLNLVMNMSDDHKETLIEWTFKNYSHNGK